MEATERMVVDQFSESFVGNLVCLLEVWEMGA